MFKLILISIISYFLGAFSIILLSIFKISSECSRDEKNLKKDYGQIAYDEIERIEKFDIKTDENK